MDNAYPCISIGWKRLQTLQGIQAMTSSMNYIVSGSHGHTKTIHGTHMISDAVTYTHTQYSRIPFVNLTYCMLPFIVDLPMKNEYVPVRYVSLPEGKPMFF